MNIYPVLKRHWFDQISGTICMNCTCYTTMYTVMGGIFGLYCDECIECIGSIGSIRSIRSIKSTLHTTKVQYITMCTDGITVYYSNDSHQYMGYGEDIMRMCKI